MANNSGAQNRTTDLYDADLALRALGSAAVTEDGTTTGVAIPAEKLGVFKLILRWGAQTGVDVSNYWALSLVGSASADMSNPVTLATHTLPAAAGKKEIALSSTMVEDSGTNVVNYLAINHNETGTNVSNLSYSAYLTELGRR